MRKNSLLKGLVGAAVLFGATISAHAADTLAAVKAAGTMKVGTETAFAPFDFIDAGEHVGLNVDLFNEIGKELGVKIEWVTLPWDGVFPALEAGKFDVVAGPATITKKRIERYRFTPPLAEATIAILKKAGDQTISKPEDIAGKKIGVGKATAQLDQLKEFSEALPTKVDIREYPAFTESYADLAAGRIAGVANSLPNIAFVAKQREGTFEVVLPPFGKKSYFGFIGLKDADHAPLMDAIDAAMLKIKADGRMATLQKKWFGASFDTPDSVKDPAF